MTEPFLIALWNRSIAAGLLLCCFVCCGCRQPGPWGGGYGAGPSGSWGMGAPIGRPQTCVTPPGGGGDPYYPNSQLSPVQSLNQSNSRNWRGVPQNGQGVSVSIPTDTSFAGFRQDAATTASSSSDRRISELSARAGG